MQIRLLVALSVVLTLMGTVRSAHAQLQAELFVGGFSQPVAFVQDPSQPGVQVVVQQGGRIRVVQNGVLLAQDFLDLTSQVASGGERGLLGLAFAPDYATSGRVYVNFTNLSGDTVIARFLRHAGDPLRADPTTRFDLVWGGQPFIDQPFDNHNGGHLAFGPDGYLYIGLGDGGGGNDPLGNAQNPATLLGKMLRIDVSVGLSHPYGYQVPPTNPWAFLVGPPVVGFPPLPSWEIWAFGLRNPWRYSFDDPARGGTGALIIGDVGQNGWEEVNYTPAGVSARNYGWPNREGLHANVSSPPPYFTPLTDPVHEYSHADGRAITGGFVYRGSALGATYVGRYFFADIISNRVWSLALSIDGAGEASAAGLIEHTGELGAGATAVSSFGVDADGELYLVSYGLGAVYRIVSDATAPPVDACVTPDPFVVLGGGTCCNGDWLPPGLTCSGAPVTPPPSPDPPPVEACVTPDPFVVLGGGTCCNGDWLPPGLTCSGAPVTPPPSPDPPPVEACVTPDPFVVLGGGTCCNGDWLPPGLTCSGTPVTPPPPPDVACVTPDPFVVLGGGTCCSGDWLPPGLACSAPPSSDTGACNILLMEPEPGGAVITSVTASPEGGAVEVWTLVDPPLSCQWSARAEPSWIIVTSPAYPTLATGDGAVFFTVAPNTTGVERTGRIQVAEKFLTVVQPPMPADRPPSQVLLAR